MSAVEVIFTSTTITLDITIFNNWFSAERDYEYQIDCTEYYLLLDTKKLNTLNNITALLKSVLFEPFPSMAEGQASHNLL